MTRSSVSAGLLAGVVLCGALLALTGCPDNPYKASTWTKKLGDPREAERAVTQLEQLGDPSAIEALGEAWANQGKPGRLLQVIIQLARPLTPAQAEATNMTDYAKTGRPDNWAKAMPYLTKALTEVDEANSRSVESAGKAAEALGEAKLAEGLEALVEVAQKPVTKKLINAQISAIRALGKFDNERTKATEALVKIIDHEPPDNPKTAKDKDVARALGEKFELYLGTQVAAVDALGELHSAGAVKALILSMYRTPEVFDNIRRALLACGPAAEEELRKILRGQNESVEALFADKVKHYDRYCGDKNDAPADQCQPVSAKEFYPTVVLGDFYDPKAVKDLLLVLDHPVLPQYYQDDQASPSTQYSAVFDALTKIGAAEGADRIHAMWSKSTPAPAKGKGAPSPAAAADTQTRILAIGAFPFVTRDDTGLDELGKIAGDNAADDGLRQQAATAFARLAHSPDDVKVLKGLADKYFDASDKQRKIADGKPKADKEVADKELDKVKKALDDAKAAATKAVHDTSKSPADAAAAIRAATEAAKKLEDDYKVAKKKHKDAIAPFKMADDNAKGYKAFARMFQTHMARIEVAIRCKSDKNELNCYVGTLKETPDQAAKNMEAYIADVKDWKPDERLGLLEGEVERAMLEIGKQGSKAAGLSDQLLDAVKSDDRLIRQSIQLALPKITKVPCPVCVTKIDAAIKAGEGKTTVKALNLETTMLRNYFAWAGGNTPSASAPAGDAPAPSEAPKTDTPPAPSKPAAPPPPAKAAPKGKKK